MAFYTLGEDFFSAVNHHQFFNSKTTKISTLKSVFAFSYNYLPIIVIFLNIILHMVIPSHLRKQ